MERRAKESGLNVVLGARPDDANALIRMRNIYDYFDFATSNILCSAILYAGFSGCKISISGPYNNIIEDAIFADIKLNYDSIDKNFASRLSHTLTREYARRNYPLFCHESPKDSRCQVNVCRGLIGWDKRLNNDEIYDLLRWSPADQVEWAVRGVLRRVRRHLRRFQV